MSRSNAPIRSGYRTVSPVPLRCHPATPTDLVRGIAVRVGWEKDGTLAFTFVLEGDLTRVRIPAPRPPGRADGLWQHTCFEAFLRYPGQPEYCELNFAPSGQWAAYRFRRYREEMSLMPDVDPHLAVVRTAERLQLEAVLHLYCLPLEQPRARLQLALAAVVEDADGRPSYWALCHPPGKPDFHHPRAFALELTRSEKNGASIPSGEGKR